jgi:hypothetical protein
MDDKNNLKKIYTKEELNNIIQDNMNFHKKRYLLSLVEKLPEEEFCKLLNKYIIGKDLLKLFEQMEVYYQLYFDVELFGKNHIISENSFFDFLLNKINELSIYECNFCMSALSAWYMKKELFENFVQKLAYLIINKIKVLTLEEKIKSRTNILNFFSTYGIKKNNNTPHIIKEYDLYDMFLKYTEFKNDEIFICNIFCGMKNSEIKECLINWNVPDKFRKRILNIYFKRINLYLFHTREYENVDFSDCVKDIIVEKHNDYFYYISMILFFENILTDRQKNICIDRLLNETNNSFENIRTHRKKQLLSLAKKNNNKTLKNLAMLIKLT